VVLGAEDIGATILGCALAVAGGAAVVVAPSWVLVAFVCVVILSVVIFRVVVPGNAAHLTPTRLYLPILTLYMVAAVLVVRPETQWLQLAALALFALTFWVGDRLGRFFTAASVSVSRAAKSVLIVRPSYLAVLEAVAVCFIGYTFRRHGVPIFASDVAGVRVELAEGATIYIVGVAAAQVALVTCALALLGRLEVQLSRTSLGLQATFLTGLLIATAGRAHVLSPYVLVGVYLLLDSRRVRAAVLTASLLGATFFTIAGLYRGSGSSHGVAGPTRAYLTSTSETTDRIIRTEDSGRLRPDASGFTWIPRRWLGENVEPPGIVVREFFGLELAGFGAEMGILGALWYGFGHLGPPLGGLVFGFGAGVMYMLSRRRGGWWRMFYAYTLLWLLLSVTQHPFANYWYAYFPLILVAFAYANWASAPALKRDQQVVEPSPVGTPP
jgi:hypothetical protein